MTAPAPSHGSGSQSGDRRSLAGGGEMGALIRAYDWSSTLLGPIETWPQSLKTAVDMIVYSAFPAAIAWGPSLVTIYNDGFRPILGAKPEALGRPFSEVWSEAWEEIGPIADRALAGEPTFVEDFPLIVERNGYPEQTYFTFCYSPVRDEAGNVAGFLDTVVETTAKVLTEKALRTSEERLREAQDIAGLGRWEFDVATGGITWSDHVFRIFDRDPEAGEPTFEELRDLIHADDRARFDALVQDALAEGRDFETEWRALRPDGSYRWKRTRARADRDESGKVVRLVGTDIDITERKRSEEHRELLMHELDHRVKNILATVQSIAAQTLPRDGAGGTFAQRLTALADAHGLLAQSRWGGTELRALVETSLAPYRDEQISLAGEDVLLLPKAAQVLAMVLHELATNAAKYGALSKPEGRLSVSWEIEGPTDRPHLMLRWAEIGGPAVKEPNGLGFGSKLIQQSIAYELGGEARLEYRLDGARCTLTIPLGESGHGGLE